MSRLASTARETLPKPENTFSQPNTPPNSLPGQALAFSSAHQPSRRVGQQRHRIQAWNQPPTRVRRTLLPSTSKLQELAHTPPGQRPRGENVLTMGRHHRADPCSQRGGLAGLHWHHRRREGAAGGSREAGSRDAPPAFFRRRLLRTFLRTPRAFRVEGDSIGGPPRRGSRHCSLRPAQPLRPAPRFWRPMAPVAGPT